MSPTQRSLAELRANGYTVAIVEKFNSFIKIRQDLFGFADLIAYNEEEVILIQTTSANTGGNMAARRTKIMASPYVRSWLAHPSRKILLHGWRKGGARGERKTWRCNQELITLQRGRLVAVECAFAES